MSHHTMRVSQRTVLTTLLLLICAAAPAVAEIPPRPEQIDFPPLAFEPPDAADYRHVLSNGVPVYLAPSREFPLINVSFTFRGGQYLDSPEMVGLAQATGAMMRRGGTTTMSAEDLDEELDFLAAQAGAAGPTGSQNGEEQ